MRNYGATIKAEVLCSTSSVSLEILFVFNKQNFVIRETKVRKSCVETFKNFKCNSIVPFVLAVMFMLIGLLALSGAALAQRNTPHPCADATGPTPPTFANDFATCEAYFWCSGPSAGYPSGPCDAGFHFDPLANACNSDLATADCQACPPVGSGLWAVSSE